jgi:hypothetical protein
MPFTFERSPDTDAVIDVLRGCNDQIAYPDIATRAGLTLERAKGVLASARRVLRKDGILFGTIMGHGVHRLTDLDKVKKPETFKRRVARGAGREIKDLSTIADFGKLSKTDQHCVTLNRTLLHAIKQSASVQPEKVKPATTAAPLPNTGALIQQRRP